MDTRTSDGAGPGGVQPRDPHRQPERPSRAQRLLGPDRFADTYLDVRAAQGRQGGERRGRRGAAADDGATRRHRTGRRGGAQGRDQARHVGVGAVPAVAVEEHRVDGADGLGGVVEIVQQRQDRPLERHGERQPPPARVEPVEEARQGVGGDVVRVVRPVQAQLGVGGAVQQRRQRVVDRVPEHPAASRAGGSLAHVSTGRCPRSRRRASRRTAGARGRSRRTGCARSRGRRSRSTSSRPASGRARPAAPARRAS